MQTEQQQTFALTIERTIRAPRARVFEAFVNPDDLARWSAPEGLDVAEGDIDLRVGGRWTVVMHDPGTGRRYHAEGVYREITSPERLVYTHAWPSDATPVETLITVEFHDEGKATRVVMRHEGFLSESSRTGHEEGWSSCFDRLEAMFT
jgi:glutathione S-transferase